MTHFILDKTEKGRDELATRQHQLSPRLRTLLVLADGKSDADNLMKKVAGLGLTDRNIAELVEQGFLRYAEQKPAEAPVETHNDGISEAPVEAQASDVMKTAPVFCAAAVVVTPAAMPSDEALHLKKALQLQEVYAFFNETIKSAIGLRGVPLQLKVERAATLADYAALRQPYLDAVIKAKGSETAEMLRMRLDELLAPRDDVALSD